MAKSVAYSLWIIPDGITYSLTAGYISKISSGYHLPTFEPHVTILGEIFLPKDTMMSKAIELANNLAPFRIHLAREVKYLDEYFRCLFIKAHKTKDLMKTFSTATEIFSYSGNAYFPHLSLAYGEIPVQTKRKMIQKLGTIPSIEFEARNICMVLASSRTPISRWKVINRFPFTQPS
jgi:2'-5' RNA ligase